MARELDATDWQIIAERQRDGRLGPTSAGPGPTAEDCRLADFVEVVSAVTDLADYPHADAVRQNVLVYSGARLRPDAGILPELARALMDGPGIVVVTGAFPDLAVVDRVTEVFAQIVAEQRAAGNSVGDHFAKPGANDRIWNALEKLALRDPAAFAGYYANDVLATVCTAWLGPAYQMTSQVNVVNPGGAAQTVHRDYHLGFQSDGQAAGYPAHVHRLSPALTLQGAVAHADMPVETGPTLYLPHSQKYLPGYVAYRRADFREYFASNHIQLPLTKGDAVFFNPALFHAAGANRSADVRRMANLLQVSSAFGRAMETVDRHRISIALYRTLLGMGDRAAANVIACCAEGYPFPTDLDRDPAIGSLAPASQADLLTAAVAERWPAARLENELNAWAGRRLGCVS